MPESKEISVPKKPLSGGKRATQSNRRGTNLKMNHDVMRAKISGGLAISTIKKIDKELQEISSNLADNTHIPMNNDATIEPSVIDLEVVKVRIVALKTRADLNFRKLAKVLPDLKSIDLSTEVVKGSPVLELLQALKDEDEPKPSE